MLWWNLHIENGSQALENMWNLIRLNKGTAYDLSPFFTGIYVDDNTYWKCKASHKVINIFFIQSINNLTPDKNLLKNTSKSNLAYG